MTTADLPEPNEPIDGVPDAVAAELDREQLWWVVRAVMRKHRVSATHLFADGGASGARLPNVIRARGELMVVLHDTFGYGWSEIARLVGRDHTTVMYVVRRHHDALDRQYLGHVRREPWVAKVKPRTARLERERDRGAA